MQKAGNALHHMCRGCGSDVIHLTACSSTPTRFIHKQAIMEGYQQTVQETGLEKHGHKLVCLLPKQVFCQWDGLLRDGIELKLKCGRVVENHHFERVVVL